MNLKEYIKYKIIQPIMLYFGLYPKKFFYVEYMVGGYKLEFEDGYEELISNTSNKINRAFKDKLRSTLCMIVSMYPPPYVTNKTIIFSITKSKIKEISTYVMDIAGETYEVYFCNTRIDYHFGRIPGKFYAQIVEIKPQKGNENEKYIPSNLF